MTKNIKSLVLLAIFSVAILGVLFFVFRGDNGDAESASTNNQSMEAPKSDEDSNNEMKQGIDKEGVLSEIPQALKGLQFTDKYQKDDYELAIKAEEDIIKDAKNYDAYNAAGFYWKSLGDLTGKDSYYMRAIEVYVFAGKYFEAKKIYQSYQNAANVYIILKDYAKAEEMMKSAIALGPEVGILYVRLADLYQNYQKSPSQKIIDLYESALHQELYQPEVLYPAYAQYLCGIGQEKQAEERTKLKCNSF